jgi:flagellar basal body-associated protein FliL
VKNEENERPLFKRDYFGLELTILIIIVIVVVIVSMLFLLAMFGELST